MIHLHTLHAFSKTIFKQTSQPISFYFWSWLGCGILLTLCRIAICLAIQIGFTFLNLLPYLETAWYTVRLLFAAGGFFLLPPLLYRCVYHCAVAASLTAEPAPERSACYRLSLCLAAVAVGVAVAVLPLGDSLVFAAGSRCTGWNLVDDGSFAICHVVCFLCSRIFLAFASADRCTGVTGARTKCTLQDDFTPCIFADGWQKKTVVQIVAAKSAALVAAALLEQDCDDADGLYRRDLQGITICQ